jgi:mycoredoxin-dependent peroxiredoxin
MSQSEIASGRNTLPGELPELHRLIPDMELSTADGRPLRLSDYRGRRNLVLVLADSAEASKLLPRLAAVYDQIVAEDGELIAVLWARNENAASLALPFPVLVETTGEFSRRFGAVDDKGGPAPALYITDRFGEIYAVFRKRDGQPFPAPAEIISTLEFVNIQCPECAPPEWPT